MKTTVWSPIGRASKLLELMIYSGSIFSAGSTLIIIYIYCHRYGIKFLMPLMLSKISGGMFLLFVILILFIVFLPVFFGCWGGDTIREYQEKTKTRLQKTENNERTIQGFFINIKKYIKKFIVYLPNSVEKMLYPLDWDTTCVSAFLFLLSPLIFFIFPIFYSILISLFFLMLVVNSSILLFFRQDSKLRESFLGISLSAIGGSFFIIIYFVLFRNFINNPIDMIFIACFPPLLSSISFFIGISKRYFIFKFVGLVLFFIYFASVLQSKAFSDSYFRWAGYGRIPVRIFVVPPTDKKQRTHLFKSLAQQQKGRIMALGKHRPKSPTNAYKQPYKGTILFNSGSDLYVGLDSKQNSIPSSEDLYVKQKKFPKKIRPNQIIRISYNDLESIPRF